MKYRAVCPSCQKHFSRWYYFKTIPEWKHKCSSCGANFKSNSLWEWTGNFFFGIPTAVMIVLALSDVVEWYTAIIIIGIIFLLQIILFPYFTKYDLINNKENNVEQNAVTDG